MITKQVLHAVAFFACSNLPYISAIRLCPVSRPVTSSDQNDIRNPTSTYTNIISIPTMTVVAQTDGTSVYFMTQKPPSGWTSAAIIQTLPSSVNKALELDSVYDSQQQTIATPSTEQDHATTTSARVIPGSGSHENPIRSPGKRGLAYNDPDLLELFVYGREISWAYNWDSVGDNVPHGLEFIPTLWGLAQDHVGPWLANARASISKGSRYIMSFNEPDISTQANIDPQDAAKAYLQYIQPLSSDNVKLLSPAVSNGQGRMGLDWLSRFLAVCTTCRIDMINIHWYGSYTDVESFKAHCQNASTIGGNKSVIVSEFATTDGTPDQKKGFLRLVLPWLDQQNFIEMYSYFMLAEGMLVNGSRASDYGEVYANWTLNDLA